MVLLDDRSKGVRLEVERRGKAALFTLRLSFVAHEQVDSVNASLRVFAEMLALRLPGRTVKG